MHSLISIDLGNSRLPNLLLDDESLQYALSAPNDMNRQPGGLLYDNFTGFVEFYRSNKIPKPWDHSGRKENLVFLNESYSAFRSQMGELGTNNATILSQYLCSVPEQKSTWTMLIAIVMADIVFLQTAWRLFSLAAENMASNNSDTALFCKGCLGNLDKMVQVDTIEGDTKCKSGKIEKGEYKQVVDEQLSS